MNPRTLWTPNGDDSAMSSARDTMEGMVECYHPADRPAKWRELAKFATEQAKATQELNDTNGVPDR